MNLAQIVKLKLLKSKLSYSNKCFYILFNLLYEDNIIGGILVLRDAIYQTLFRQSVLKGKFNGIKLSRYTVIHALLDAYC